MHTLSLFLYYFIAAVELANHLSYIWLVKDFSQKHCHYMINQLMKCSLCMIIYMTSLCSYTSFATAVGLLDYLSCMASDRVTSKVMLSDESIDELFTIFDDVRSSAVNTTDTILNFIGELLSLHSSQFTLLFAGINFMQVYLRTYCS
jgi:hypothetical protein